MAELGMISDGAKAERFGLVELCRERGIEPIVLHPGDDLRKLAEDAVARGADLLGMAGGDGSEALIASVTSQHGIPSSSSRLAPATISRSLSELTADVPGSLSRCDRPPWSWPSLASIPAFTTPATSSWVLHPSARWWDGRPRWRLGGSSRRGDAEAPPDAAVSFGMGH